MEAECSRRSNSAGGYMAVLADSDARQIKVTPRQQTEVGQRNIGMTASTSGGEIRMMYAPCSRTRTCQRIKPGAPHSRPVGVVGHLCRLGYRRQVVACRSAPVARSRKFAIWRLTAFAS